MRRVIIRGWISCSIGPRSYRKGSIHVKIAAAPWRNSISRTAKTDRLKWIRDISSHLYKIIVPVNIEVDYIANVTNKFVIGLKFCRRTLNGTRKYFHVDSVLVNCSSISMASLYRTFTRIHIRAIDLECTLHVIDVDSKRRNQTVH